MFSIQIAKTPFRGQQKGGTQCVFLGFKLHVFWEYNSGILLGFLEQKESSAVLGSKFAQIKWVLMSPAIRFSTGFTIYFYRGFQFALILGSKFHANTLTGSSQTGDKNTHIPRCSMYGICAYINHKSKPNVGVCIYIYMFIHHTWSIYGIHPHKPCRISPSLHGSWQPFQIMWVQLKEWRTLIHPTKRFNLWGDSIG